MKKISLALAMVMVMVISLSACNSNNSTSTTAAAATTAKNTEKPMELYYYMGPDGGLVKINSDGTGRKKILGAGYFNIIIKNGWIYFFREPDYTVCKMKTGGTKVIRVTTDTVSHFEVQGDWVYYRGRENHYLYRINTDGTQKQKLSNKRVFDFSVSGNTVYFTEYKEYDFNPLFCVNTDGSNQKDLKISGVNGLKACGDYLEYGTYGDSTIINVKTGKELLTPDSLCDFNQKYFVFLDSNNNLCIKDLNGTNDKLLVDEEKDIKSAEIINGKIYYQVDTGEGNFFSINFDGTGKTQLPKITSDYGGIGIYVNEND